MTMLQRILLYMHILSVIMSIGPFFILIPLVKKLRGAENTIQQAYIDSFRFAVRLSKHAGHVLVVTGLLLAYNGGWSWKTPWLLATFIIMVCSLYFFARAFSPTLRKFGQPGVQEEPLLQKLLRSIWIYLILLLIMLWFMVTKPQLW